MRVVFAGGGTGGHIYPAITVAREMATTEANVDVFFIGTKRGLESKIVPRAGFPFYTVPVDYLRRRSITGLLKTSGRVAYSLIKAVSLLRRLKPDLVVGTGGYVSGPVLLAALLLRKRTAVIEQNVVPGKTNRFLGRFVDKVITSFPESAEYFPVPQKVSCLGNPIRSEIMSTNREEAARMLKVKPEEKLVLIMGGSGGAKSINEAVADSFRELAQLKETVVIHVTGPNYEEHFRKLLIKKGIDLKDTGSLRILTYLHDMPAALARADLVINRAGATTIAEITARGVPAILIPSPYTAGNHQEKNARALEKAGGCVVITEQELKSQPLTVTIKRLLSDPERLKNMAERSRALGRPNAAGEIARVLAAACGRE